MNIYVHCPSRKVFQFRVEPSETVASIDCKLHYANPLMFVHNQIILERSVPLIYYAIKDGDHIYGTIAHCTTNLELACSLKQSMKNCAPYRAVELKRTILRMLDISMDKALSNPTPGRKLTFIFNYLENQDPVLKSNAVTNIPPKNESPNDTPLPHFW